MNFKLFIALFALVGAAVAVPTRLPNSINKDHTKCSSIDNLHNEIGKTYSYSYSSKSDIEVNNGEKTQVTIKSIIDVTPIGGCEHLMHMRQVRVQGPVESEQLARRLERAPIWFRQDARRIRDIGHSVEEDHMTLNLKRAVLSAMQVSSLEDAKMVEKDIFGRCDTEYQQTSRSNSEVQLIKQKSLESCSQRRHPLASLLWKTEKNDQLNCKLTVNLNDRVIRKLHCVERAQVTPLIGSSLSTQVSNEIELQHQETRDNQRQVPSDLENYVRESIAFTKPTDLYKQYAKPEQQQELKRQAERLLQQIHEKNSKSESVEQVNNLAEAISRMNSETLEKVYEQVQKSNSAEQQRIQKLFVDLVAQSGNQEALKFMFEQAFTTESDLRRNYWLLQMSEIREASIQTIQQLIKILRQREQELPRQAMITIAKIVGQSEARSKPEVYTTAVDAISEWLHERNANKRMRIAAAQALKSVELTHSAQQQLVKIAAANNEDIELRVAAIRTLASNQEITSKVAEQLYQLYERTAEPIEIRIHAFRALIQNEQHVEKVLRRLTQESNNQVGFYAGSYLKNMKHNHRSIKSTFVQQQIERFEIPQHLISKGDKKTARHLNMRQNVQLLDADLEFDADLIYDDKQHLSAIRAKVQMDKHYQQTEQQIELYIRQRGFDRVVDRLSEQLDKDTFQRMIAQIYQLVRNGRSQQIVDQINKMLREFAFDQQMNGSIELTVNGKVLISVSTEDLAELTVEPKKNIHEMLEQMTSQIAFHNFMFRKQQLLPTVAGIALETTQQSTWMSHVQIGNGKFEPSIAYQLQVSTGFRLPYAQPRLTYKVQVHSSPSFRVHTEKDQQGYPTKFAIYMDQQRMTLWRFKSEVEFTNVEGQTKQVEQAVQQSKHCLTSLRSVVGATFCVEAKQSNKISFVADLHFFIEKEETEMKGWELNLKAPAHLHPFQLFSERREIRQQQPFVYMISIATPGSRVSREHTFEVRFENTNEAKQVKLNLISPKHRFTVEATLENKEQQKNLKIQIALNQQKALLQTSLRREEEGRYIPTVRFELPGQRPYTYTGELVAKLTGKKNVLQLKLVDEQTKTVVFNYHVIRTGRLFARTNGEQFAVSVDAQLQTPIKGEQFRYNGHLILKDNEVDYEQQYSQRWSSNAVPEVYRFTGKIMQKGNLLTENAKYTAHFEYQMPSYGAELHFNMNGQLTKTNRPHLEAELSVFTSQAGQKEKQRVLHLQKVLKVQEVREEYEINFNLIAQSNFYGKWNLNHELQLQSVVSRQMRKQQKVIVNWTFAKINQQPTLKAEAAFEMNTPAHPVLYVSAKLTTKFDSERVYALHHEIQRQDRKYQAKTKLQWSPKEWIEMQNSLLMQRESEMSLYEIEGQVRVPYQSIEWNFQNQIRISNNFELKSIVKDNKQVRSEVRVFLSRDKTSSIYVDNNLINFKAETSNFSKQQTEKMALLHLNGKSFNFFHSSRFEMKSDRTMEFVSKTTRDSATLIDVRGKMNSTVLAFSVEAAKQKASANFDRQAKKMNIAIKHDQLLNNHRHQIQIIATTQRRSLTVDAKIDMDQTVWGKFRAVYDLDQEAQLKMSFGELNAKLESTQSKRQWSGFLKYAPWNLQQTLSMTVQPETKTIEVQLKTTTSKHPINFHAKISASQQSKITFDNVHYQINFEGDYQQKTGKLNFADNQHKIQHKTQFSFDQNERAIQFESVHTESGVEQFNHNGKITLQWNKQSHVKIQTDRYQIQFNSRLPEQMELTVTDKKTNEKKHWTSIQIQKPTNKQIPSAVEIKSETKYNQKKYQQIVKINEKQVQIKFEHEKHSINFNAERTAQSAFNMWIELVDNIGYKRVQRAEANYKHNEKFEFNLQTSANDKPMHKQAQLQVYRQQQSGEWKVDMKVGSINFDLQLQNNKQQKGLTAKIQFPVMNDKYEHTFEALYNTERREGRVAFNQQINQKQEFDVRADAKWPQTFNIVMNDRETKFEFHLQATEQGRVTSFLKNSRHQWDVKLDSKWEQNRNFELQAYAKNAQKSIAQADIKFNQQQPSNVKLSLWENELKLTQDWTNGQMKLKINVPAKYVNIDAEIKKNESLDVQVFVKGTSVASFQLTKRGLHLQAMDHELSVKLQRTNEQHVLEATYQIQHLKHRTGFTLTHLPAEKKVTFHLISKQEEQLFVSWDALVVYNFAKYEVDTKLQVLKHWFVFELKNQQQLRISHAYLKQGTKKVTFVFQVVKTRPDLWTVQMNLLDQHKIDGEVVYVPRQDYNLKIRYDYVPQQYNARVQMTYKQKEQQVEYLFGAYHREQQLYVLSGNWQRVYKQLKVVVGQYEGKIQMKQPFDLTASMTVEQKKQFEIIVQKQANRLNAALSVNSFDFEGKLNLKSDSKETKLEAEINSQKYQLQHRTQVTFESKKPFELITKTESKKINFSAEANNWNNKKADSKIIYAIYGYHGNFKFEFQPNEQVVFEHECHRPNEKPYELKAKMQLNQRPLKGELIFKRQEQQTKVTIQIAPKTVEGERMHHIVISAVKLSEQKQLFHFETTFSADLMQDKRAGRLAGRLESKVQAFDKQMEFNYLLKNTNSEFQHSLKAQYQQQVYGYTVKFDEQNARLEINLPKQHKIVVEVAQKKQGEIEMTVYPNYVHESSNKYNVNFKYQIEQSSNKIQFNTFVTLKHTSIRRPITLELNTVYNPVSETPVEFKFTIDANESTKPVYVYVKVQNKPEMKQIQFQLHQSEAKHLHIAAEWLLNMPVHHQALYWRYNNNYPRVVEGGYRFHGNFEQHKYQLELKSINVFNIEWHQKSEAEYVLTVLPTEGNVQRVVLSMNLSRGESRLQIQDRQNQLHEFKGQAAFDQKNGLHLKVNKIGQTTSAAQLLVKRDNENYIVVVADMKDALLNVLKPSTHFQQTLIEYSKTHLHMQQIAHSIVEEVFTGHFFYFWAQVARDVYTVLTTILPEKTIMHIIHKKPVKPEDYIKAVEQIFEYYQNVVADWFWNDFLPHHLRVELKNLYKNVTEWAKETVKQAARTVYYITKKTIQQAGNWFNIVRKTYEEFRNLKPAEQLRRIFAEFDTLIAGLQHFVDHHVMNLINLVIEHSTGYTKQWLVRARNTIPRVSKYISSFNLAEMFINVSEILFGQQSWNGNRLQWQPEQGHFEMRFFLPKGVLHYFE